MSVNLIDDGFVPVMTAFTRDDPRLEFLDREELISLLPIQIQRELRRAEWAWEHIDDLAYGKGHDDSQIVLDPFTFEPIHDRRFTREEIMLMFDPPFVEDPEQSEKANLLAYGAGDPVVFSRLFLRTNPRIYQILILRDPSIRKVLRLGRRCGKSVSIAIDMIQKCETKPGYICMLIAPMKSQCEVVWNMLKTLMYRNEEFAQQLNTRQIHTKEAPYYEMEFPNGSVIKMFTSGVKSKGKGDNLRGQEADTLYLDEVDLMSPEDKDSFTAILRDTGRPFGEKTMMIASTPNGRRDMLYEYCTTRRDQRETDTPFTEYYFPTHADLNYKPKDDKEQRSLLTTEGYMHEILALFGEETTGVFLKAHIDRAQEHIPDGYEYLNTDDMIEHLPNQRIVVGVDWDKFGAGVNIVMCAANYTNESEEDARFSKLMPIARWEIPRGPETLTRGTEFVKTINALYKPDAIYIDRGYGDMQYEELLRSARRANNGETSDLRALGLDKRLKGIHFAENVTVYDPLTNAEINKPVKDHMVSLAIKMFEDDQIILNSRDFEETPGPTDLIKQLEGYQIVRRTMTGKPVYEAANTNVGDHALDAFLLCILAMHQEWGSFARPEQHAKPQAVAFNIFNLGGAAVTLDRDHDDMPESFRIRRTNIRAGRQTYGGGGRRLRRKGF